MKELRSETATDRSGTTRATPPVAAEGAGASIYPLQVGSSRSQVARAVLEPTTLLELAQYQFGGAAFGYSGTYRRAFGYNHPRGGACTAWLWPILFGSKPRRRIVGGIGKHRLDAEYCPRCDNTWQTISTCTHRFDMRTPDCGAARCANQGCDWRSHECECMEAATKQAPAQRLQHRPCTSQEGHRWLVDCRYEPPRCGAVWCGQVGCDVAVRCDCADPAQGAPDASAPDSTRSTLEFDSTLGYPGEGWACVPAAPTGAGGRLLVLPIHISDKGRVLVPSGGHSLFGESMLDAGGAARKSASLRAAAICKELGTDATIDTVFLAGTMHDDHVVVGVCDARSAYPVCDTWADVIVAEAVYGADSPIWCTLDAIAGGDGKVSAQRQHVYLAVAAALARTQTFMAPRREVLSTLQHGAVSAVTHSPACTHSKLDPTHRPSCICATRRRGASYTLTCGSVLYVRANVSERNA